MYYTNATNTFADALQEGEAQHSGQTAIGFVRHSSSNFARSTVDRDGVHHERWSLVKKAYLHIRQVVLNNATVMEKTSLQLPVVNTATLSSW